MNFSWISTAFINNSPGFCIHEREAENTISIREPEPENTTKSGNG
jgi:hypothetical protein